MFTQEQELVIHDVQVRRQLRLPHLGGGVGAADVAVQHGDGPGLRHLLRPHPAGLHHAGQSQ